MPPIRRSSNPRLRAIRRTLGLVAVAFAAMLMLTPSAFGAVEILSRGFLPNPAVTGTESTLTVDVRVDQAPFSLEFFCCDAFNLDTPAQTKVFDGSEPEVQQTSGRFQFTFNV